MVAETDVWHAADILIKEYGEDAEMIAAQRADALLAQGEMDGHRFFKAVLETIHELRRRSPREGEKLN